MMDVECWCGLLVWVGVGCWCGSLEWVVGVSVGCWCGLVWVAGVGWRGLMV